MKPPPDDRLPPPLDALWASELGPLRKRRPQKRGLSVERVVTAAIELADGDGLDALSMSRIAERLGFSTMSLYRHVRNKDELVALMVDFAVEPPSAADGDARAGWRAGLERWGWDLLAVVRRHPWLLEVPLPRLPFGPRRLVWLDRGLGALAETGLTADAKARVILLLNGYVFSEARTASEVEETAPGGDTERAASDHGAVLFDVVDSDRYPAFHRALEEGVFGGPGPGRDADFAFGLALILDGVERLVAASGGESRGV